jgi:predicted ester cyclase
MTPKRVVQRFLAEVLTGAGPGISDELVANEELRQRTRGLRAAFPDLEVETRLLLVEEDLVAGHFIGRGTHLGIFQGVPPTGRAWEARWTAVYRVEDDRIADAWMTWDYLSLLEQLAAVERVATVSA